MAKTKPEVNLRLFDDTALTDAEYSTTDIQSFSNLNDLKVPFDEPSDYATLEHDQWSLDGTKLIFPDDMSILQFGYWSLVQSDDNNNINIVFNIDFDTIHSTIGVTFLFYEDDYATDITVEWYDAADQLIVSRTFTNDRFNFFAAESVVEYKRIKVTFNKLNNPKHFLKLKEIGFGADVLFTENDITRLQIVEELNAISNEISINKMNLSVLIQDVDYIQDIYQVLQDQQKLIAYEYVGGIKKEMGTFYLKVRENPSDNEISFTSEDFLGVMSRETYIGGAVNDTVENVLNTIFGTYGTPLFTISDDIKDLVVAGYIPITDYRRAIQLVAFAVNAVVDCSRSDKINIYKLPTINPQPVDDSRYFKGNKQIELEKVTGASLTYESYTLGTETKDAYKVTHSAGTFTALFNEPFSNLSITGGTIDSSGVNYVTFTTVGGLVTITGMTYNVSNQIFTILKPDMLPTETENVIEFENTIIWDGIQNTQYLYDHLIGLNQRQIKIVLDNEKAGEFLSVDALYNKKIEGYVESLVIDLAGGFVGEAKINGVIV